MGHGDTKSANAAGKGCQQAPPAQGGRKPSVCSSNKKGSVCEPRSSEHAGVVSDVGSRAPCCGWAQPGAGLVASAGRTRRHPRLSWNFNSKGCKPSKATPHQFGILAQSHRDQSC